MRPCTFFFFNDTATTEIYTLSLHDALPILHPTRVTQDGPGEALGLGPRRRLERERFGVSRDGRERRLELVGHVGDEVAAHGLQASQLGDVEEAVQIGRAHV